MTAKELIKALSTIDEDKIVVLTDGHGWSNIDLVDEKQCVVEISMDMGPVFSSE